MADDYEVIQAMKKFGGGFVSALADAAMRADADNLARIRDAFPEFWRQYGLMADRAYQFKKANS